MDSDPTPRGGIVRCCLGGTTEALLTHIFRIVSNYDLAPDLDQVDILRLVVKENFTGALLDRFISDIVCISARCHRCPRSSSRWVGITEDLIKQDTPTHTPTTLGKHHGKPCCPCFHERAHCWVEEQKLASMLRHVKCHALRRRQVHTWFVLSVVREGRSANMSCSGVGNSSISGCTGNLRSLDEDEWHQ